MVPRGDAAALAQALGRVIDDEAWGRELGRRARRRVETSFSLEAVGRQLRALLLGPVEVQP
jgi:starch synthase